MAMALSERDHFERLCAMREAYRASPDHGRGSLSIEDAVIYVQAVMVADADPALDPEAPDRPETRSDTSVAMVEFDWTDASHQVRRVDLPALGPRADGHWMSADDGWRHLGVLLDRFGPTGDRQD
jgi:hypothetical protein